MRETPSFVNVANVCFGTFHYTTHGIEVSFFYAKSRTCSFIDYKMNLLEVRDSAGYAFRNEDVQSAFEITREVFAGNFAGIRERYKDKRISSEALSLIGQMAGSTESMEMGKSMEVTNMCTALERLKAEGIEQGMEKGVKKQSFLC